MKIFASFNIKGGVGKTTTAVNLSYLSATEGARTLVWDLDPQGGTSYYFCVQPKVQGGAKGLMKNSEEINSLLRMTGFPNLDILPADMSYRNMNQYLSKAAKPTRVLQEILEPLASQYDHLFLDCPPDLSLVAENVFDVADVLIVPLIPTTLSLRAYNRLVRFLVKRRPKRLVILPFFNLVDDKKPIHRAVTANVRSKHPIFLRESIPAGNIIEAMGVKRAPIFTYARESTEADAYRALWREIKERVGMA
jgi:cellulose biosynthesis protein BcsQ